MIFEDLPEARLGRTWNDQRAFVRSEKHDEVALDLPFLFDEKSVRSVAGAERCEIAREKTIQPRLPLGTSNGDQREVGRFEDKRASLRTEDLLCNVD